MPRSVTLPRGVRLLPSGRYQVRVPIPGKRKQAPVGTFPTVKAARAALEEAKVQVRNGTFLTPAQRAQQAKEAAEREAAEERAANATVDTVSEAWFAWMEKRNLKRGTIDTRRSQYDMHVKPAFGETPIRQVTADQIDDWFASIAATRPGAARGAYAAASSLFAFAAGTARHAPRTMKPYIRTSPCQIADATKHRPVRKQDRRICTPEEIQALADGMEPKYRFAVLLMTWCALREGEVLELRRKDFVTLPRGDRAEGKTMVVIRVQRQVQRSLSGEMYVTTPKSDAGLRDVVLPPNLIPVWEEQLTRFAGFGRDGLLFPLHDHGRGDDWTMHRQLVYRFEKSLAKFNADQEEQGKPTLTGFTAHNLRHTGLTNAGYYTQSLTDLMALGGHSDPKVAMGYQHATTNRLADVADLLPVPVQRQEAAKVTDIASARSKSTKTA